MERYQGAAAVELCFPKDESKHGNVEVECRYPQQANVVAGGERLETLQDGCGMILITPGVKCKAGIQRLCTGMAGNAEHLRQRSSQLIKQLKGNSSAWVFRAGQALPVCAYRQQVDGVHRWTGWRFLAQPQFAIDLGCQFKFLQRFLLSSFS